MFRRDAPVFQRFAHFRQRRGKLLSPLHFPVRCRAAGAGSLFVPLFECARPFLLPLLPLFCNGEESSPGANEPINAFSKLLEAFENDRRGNAFDVDLPQLSERTLQAVKTTPKRAVLPTAFESAHALCRLDIAHRTRGKASPAQRAGETPASGRRPRRRARGRTILHVSPHLSSHSNASSRANQTEGELLAVSIIIHQKQRNVEFLFAADFVLKLRTTTK